MGGAGHCYSWQTCQPNAGPTNSPIAETQLGVYSSHPCPACGLAGQLAGFVPVGPIQVLFLLVTLEMLNKSLGPLFAAWDFCYLYQ